MELKVLHDFNVNSETERVLNDCLIECYKQKEGEMNPLITEVINAYSNYNDSEFFQFCYQNAHRYATEETIQEGYIFIYYLTNRSLKFGSFGVFSDLIYDFMHLTRPVFYPFLEMSISYFDNADYNHLISLLISNINSIPNEVNGIVTYLVNYLIVSVNSKRDEKGVDLKENFVKIKGILQEIMFNPDFNIATKVAIFDSLSYFNKYLGNFKFSLSYKRDYKDNGMRIYMNEVDSFDFVDYYQSEFKECAHNFIKKYGSSDKLEQEIEIYLRYFYYLHNKQPLLVKKFYNHLFSSFLILFDPKYEDKFDVNEALYVMVRDDVKCFINDLNIIDGVSE